MPRRLLALSLLLLAMSVAAQGRPLVVAHRGASWDAPENTMAAFRLAFARGADAIEGDFYLTRDGQVVCTHDRTTGRFNAEDRDVRASTLAELRALDVGAWKDAAYAGERMPTLQEVLAAVPAGKRIFVEAKGGPEMTEALLNGFDNAKIAPEQITVIAFDAELVAALEKRRPALHTCWLTSFRKDEKTGAWSPAAHEVVERAQGIATDGVDVHANLEVVDAQFVHAIRKAGLELHTWTVNDYATVLRLRHLGVDSITTDRPGLVREAVDAAPLAASATCTSCFDEPHTGSSHAKDSASAAALQLRTRGDVRAQLRFAPGVFGRAIDLTGEDGYLLLDTRLPPSGTLSMWIRVPRFYDYVTLIDTPAHEDEWEAWIYANGTLRFRVHRQGAVLSHRLHARGDLDRWIHVAIVWDARDTGPGAVRLYVDGHRAAQSSWGRQVPAPGPALHLGGGHPKNTKGKLLIDDFALFARPLTEWELESIHHRGVARTLLGEGGDRR